MYPKSASIEEKVIFSSICNDLNTLKDKIHMIPINIENRNMISTTNSTIDEIEDFI